LAIDRDKSLKQRGGNRTRRMRRDGTHRKRGFAVCIPKDARFSVEEYLGLR
jgi:hypothetical protein